MCPLCLASIAATVVATTGGGAAATALVVRVKRALTKPRPTRRERRPHAPG